MPKPNNRGRTRRSGLLIVGIGVLVLVGAAATLIAIVGWKSITNVFAHNKNDAHAGKMAVVVSPVPLAAFTAIDPAVFIDQRTGDFRAAWVTEKVARDNGLIRDPGQMRGRVLKRDKGAGLAFTEADFYPPGTAASPTAAIEPGYRGVHLSTQKVDGLIGLKRFDRVDLVAVIDVRATGTGTDSGTVMAPEVAAASQSQKQWKTERRVLAQNARIIEPVLANKTGSAATECLVAIREEEVAALADAIAKGAKVVCSARSGLPGGDMSQIVEEEVAPPDSIQVISGKNSWRAIVPSGKSDDEATQDPEPKKDPK
jgi:hypothetical protein